MVIVHLFLLLYVHLLEHSLQPPSLVGGVFQDCQYTVCRSYRRQAIAQRWHLATEILLLLVVMSDDADNDKDDSVAGAQHWYFVFGMFIGAYIDGALFERW